MVDRAEHGDRVVGLHEGTGPVVDGLARDRHVVGVHHPVHEPDEHPAGQQRRLGGHDRLEQREVAVFGVGGAGVMPGYRVIRESPQQAEVAGVRGVLEAADAQMAARHPGEHGPGQGRLPLHRTSGRHHGQGSGGRDPQCVHGLADDVLAKHRTDRGKTVAATRERRTAGALEVEVAAWRLAEFAEQKRAPVAQPRDEPAELMTGVGLCDGFRACRDPGADQEPEPVGTAQPRWRRGRVLPRAPRSAPAGEARARPRPASGRPSRAVRGRSGFRGRWSWSA